MPKVIQKAQKLEAYQFPLKDYGKLETFIAYAEEMEIDRSDYRIIFLGEKDYKVEIYGLRDARPGDWLVMDGELYSNEQFEKLFIIQNDVSPKYLLFNQESNAFIKECTFKELTNYFELPVDLVSFTDQLKNLSKGYTIRNGKHRIVPIIEA